MGSEVSKPKRGHPRTILRMAPAGHFVDQQSQSQRLRYRADDQMVIGPDPRYDIKDSEINTGGGAEVPPEPKPYNGGTTADESLAPAFGDEYEGVSEMEARRHKTIVAFDGWVNYFTSRFKFALNPAYKVVKVLSPIPIFMAIVPVLIFLASLSWFTDATQANQFYGQLSKPGYALSAHSLQWAFVGVLVAGAFMSYYAAQFIVADKHDTYWLKMGTDGLVWYQMILLLLGVLIWSMANNFLTLTRTVAILELLMAVAMTRNFYEIDRRTRVLSVGITIFFLYFAVVYWQVKSMNDKQLQGNLE